jgi:hypothetical protein
MKTDISIEDVSVSNRTANSIVDMSTVRRTRIRGGSVIKGTIEFLDDFSNDVEVFTNVSLYTL